MHDDVGHLLLFALELKSHSQSSRARVYLERAREREREMGGGEHGGRGGGSGHYLGYPKEVWSPTGGWFCDPRYWRRNTALALAGIFAVAIPIAMKSVQLEQRPLMPVRPIPSQLWCKNFGKPAEAE